MIFINIILLPCIVLSLKITETYLVDVRLGSDFLVDVGLGSDLLVQVGHQLGSGISHGDETQNNLK